MLSFWTWLRDFAARRVEADYMVRYHHARLCPNCRTWTHQVGGAKDTRDEGMIQYMQCKKCEEWSRWDMIGMLPALAVPWWRQPTQVEKLPPST